MKKDKNKNNKINICIIGAGPIGLYLACYLDYYYNSGSLNEWPKVNILIFDNSISREGIRKPYSRYRPFVTSSPLLSLILPKIYTFNKDKNLLHINIYVLEYILLSQIYFKYKLPIIFEDYNWDKYKVIFEEASIDVVFDCSGGKLKTNLFSNIDDNWLNNLNKIDESISKQLLIDKNNNLVSLIDYPINKKFKKNYFYGSLVVSYMDGNFFYKYDININDYEDLFFLNKINKKYYIFSNIIKILTNIRNDINRNFLYSILISNKKKLKKFLFNFDIWSINIRHTIQPSEIFSVNNKKKLYIGTGDTIFHSHFIVGAGLNRSLKFAVKCANYLEYIKI